MTDNELEFELAMRSVVTIKAPPERVWNYLDRPRDWKPSIVSLELIAGTAGAEGETLRVGQRPAAETVHVIMRTLRLAVPSWRVQTLATEGSRAVEGFLLYSLRAVATGTELSCEFVALCRVPPAVAAADRDFARQVGEATLSKLDADHLALKQLVEQES